jgi:hypothetical protein
MVARQAERGEAGVELVVDCGGEGLGHRYYCRSGVSRDRDPPCMASTAGKRMTRRAAAR